MAPPRGTRSTAATSVSLTHAPERHTSSPLHGSPLIAAGRPLRLGRAGAREDAQVAAHRALGAGNVVHSHRHVDDPRRGIGHDQRGRPAAVQVDRVRDAVVGEQQGGHLSRRHALADPGLPSVDGKQDELVARRDADRRPGIEGVVPDFVVPAVFAPWAQNLLVAADGVVEDGGRVGHVPGHVGGGLIDHGGRVVGADVERRQVILVGIALVPVERRVGVTVRTVCRGRRAQPDQPGVAGAVVRERREEVRVDRYLPSLLGEELPLVGTLASRGPLPAVTDE